MATTELISKYQKQPNTKGGNLGIYIPLISLYFFFEYGRPFNPLHIPSIISVVLFLGWVFSPQKHWSPQITCLLLFLGLMVLHIPLAVNTYSAYWTTYNLFIFFICVSIPLVHFVTSLRKFTFLTLSLILVFLYVAIYAVFHNGFGPSGAGGGQDQNYVGAAMAMAIPLSYYSLIVTKSSVKKLFFGSTLVFFVLATVIGLSRGGTVAVGAVILYLLFKSTRNLQGIIILSSLVLSVLTFAAPSYWEEMSTITNTKEETVNMRFEVWKISLRIFKDNPIIGVGPGNFQWNIEGHQSEEQFENIGRSLSGSIVTHSMFFEILAEFGTVGILLFGAILYYNYRDLKYINKKGKEMAEWLNNPKVDLRFGEKKAVAKDITTAQHYGHALAGSIFGCLVAGIFLSLFYFSYFWILTAMVISLRQVTEERAYKFNARSI